MINLITTILLIIFLYFATKYARSQIQKLGFAFTLVLILKWFIGVLITFFAFYIIYLAGNYMKEFGLSVVFSLPVGIVAWFIPMHYSSKFFISLEKRYSADSNEEHS